MKIHLGLLLACVTAFAWASPESESLYLQGAKANRAGQFDAAEQLLRRAEAAGLRNPELDFELGWSFMARGQAEACITRLEKFEAAAPGRGQASEFLGRCHLALRQYDKAEARLNEAVRRDPRLAPTVNLSLARLDQARGRTDAARARLETAAATDSPTGRALRELAGPPEPAVQPDKPLRLSLSFSGGHNSNVIGLGNTIPLPADISRKSADFMRFTAGGSYTRQVEADTALTLGYAYLSDRYEDIGGANLLDHFVYGDLFHQFNARTAFSLRVSGEFTTLAGARFRDVLSFRPAVSYRHNPDAVTELAWSLSQNDYLAATAQAFNRDGETQALSLVHSFRLRGTQWGGAVGGTWTRNRTEGSDFNSDAVGVSGTLRYTFPNRVVAALGGGVSWDNYRDPNSLSGFARDDRQLSLSAQLTGPLTDSVRWFAAAQALRNRSNIAFYDYRQTSVTAGIAYDF
jgi:tetratricopeptide (TPR) repeat protein